MDAIDYIKENHKPFTGEIDNSIFDDNNHNYHYYYVKYCTDEYKSVAKLAKYCDMSVQELLNTKKLIVRNYEICIPSSLINLEYLDCSFDKKDFMIKNIISPSLINLKTLICRNVMLTKIPETLINLEYLDCSNNAIRMLPNTLINLQHLNCSNNKLKEFPSTYVNLKYLDCSRNKIKEIPTTLINLISLDYYKTDLDEVPNVPKLKAVKFNKWTWFACKRRLK